jgi:hypothetical protein
MFSNVILPKKTPEYNCEKCNFVSCNKKDYTRHIQTKKHISNVFQWESIEKTPKNPKKPLTVFECKCGKTYNDNSGLWRHTTKGKCNYKNIGATSNTETVEHTTSTEMISMQDITPTNEIHELREFMKYLMKENTDMKSMMMEVIKKDTYNNCNNTTNSHNKAFNLNFFLNETCKDAMNIMDFVESIKLQVSDLESVGELGYIEGISNIIVKNLNALDVTQRPVHCTDKKRETIYIKDDNKWEKDEQQKKMHKMIKKVADKNARLLPKFTEKYPDYKNYHSKTSDKYSKIIIEAMGGSGDNDYEKEEKIIKNITKCIIVDKDA